MSPKNERIAQELEELMDCAERYALIENVADGYQKRVKDELARLNSELT